MPKLKIKRDELIDALTFRFDMTDSAFYLDTETGHILLRSEDAEDVAGDIEDQVPEDIDDDPRYLRIEPIESDESFRIMEDFVETVQDAQAAARLNRALGGRKPFRRFKDVLLDFPHLREAWFEFERVAQARLAEAWCEENDIEVEWI